MCAAKDRPPVRHSLGSLPPRQQTPSSHLETVFMPSHPSRFQPESLTHLITDLHATHTQLIHCQFQLVIYCMCQCLKKQKTVTLNWGWSWLWRSNYRWLNGYWTPHIQAFCSALPLWTQHRCICIAFIVLYLYRSLSY